MNKKKSPLDIAKEEAENAIKRTNSKIDELGAHTRELYYSLSRIRELFDTIRNVSSDKSNQFEKLKKQCLTWKQNVEEIENNYNITVSQSKGMAGGGTALGVGVATLGPTAAMGVATTFGVASTGTAISTLSGAAATNAALAWLGGGALATGGGGVVAGEALLALAGPLGWSIAAVTLTISGIMFWIAKQNRQRLENIYTLISKRDVNNYDLATVEINERIVRIVEEIPKLNEASDNIIQFGTDYSLMTEQQQYTLGSYLNLMFASTNLLVNPILGLQPKYTEIDFEHYENSLNNCINLSQLTAQFQLLNDSQKKAIISLANLLYRIEMDEKDEQVLYKSLKKNKEFLKSTMLKKNDFNEFIIPITRAALKFKYITV